MAYMERHRLQLSVGSLLVLVACIALNLWLFRLGPLLGILGLNITKHVLIAWLCQAVGVDQRRGQPAPVAAPRPDPEPGPPAAPADPVLTGRAARLTSPDLAIMIRGTRPGSLCDCRPM